jgi:hypothetical protein
MKKFLLLLILLYGSVASADEIDMRDYIKLRKGMSEAEVLYRLGPPDHETVKSDYHDSILRKTWFFMPMQQSNGKWITEIEFDANGRIINLDRNRLH